MSNAVIIAIKGQQSAHPNYSLIVTGHSLGGAIASIASASLYGLGLALRPYTFGQFRTGNPAYASYIDSIYPPGSAMAFRRVTHGDDGVPQTETVAQGYLHHSTELWELEPFGANNTERCGQDVPECNNSRLGLGIGNGGRGVNAAHLCE